MTHRTLRRTFSILLLASLIFSETALPLSYQAFAAEGDAAATESSGTSSEESGASSTASDEADAAPAPEETETSTTSETEETAPPEGYTVQETPSGESEPAPTQEEPASEEGEESPAPEETPAPETVETPGPAPASGGGGSSAPSSSSDETAQATTTTETLEDLTVTAPALESAATSSLASTTDPLPATATSTATTTPEGPEIVSGRAVAIANILNLLNATFVNSRGAIVFSNIFGPANGAIDLRNALSTTTGAQCGILACVGADEVLVNVENDAHIENAIVLRAATGGNSVEGDGGSIMTGDAYAGLNLINIANSTFVDSDYLLVTLNAFDGVNGDIVFPSLTDFFSSIASGLSGGSSVSSANNGTIDNAVEITTDSGGNAIAGEGGTTTTGDTHSYGNVFNQLNANVVGGASVSILFRVHGSWAGEIFGAPPGLSWTRTADGSIFLFDAASGGGSGTASTSVTTSNTAVIDNDVSVIALTGDNTIDGDNALITTGDAYAGANIVNIGNSTVVGRNWILAIVNIFGDFTGNIAFGRPDLWVGEQVEVPDKLRDGNEITYKFTVINNGDAEATETTLTDNYDAAHLEVLSSSVEPVSRGNGTLTWRIGTLPPGAATEISYTARVMNAGQGQDITNVVTVDERETDNNPDDNTDTATVRTYKRPKIDRAKEEPLAIAEMEVRLGIERATPTTTLRDDERTAHQKVIITNDTEETARSVVVHDIVRDASGAVIHDEMWELGDVLANEEIILEYDIHFAPNAVPGTYILSTAVDGPDTVGDFQNGTIVIEAAPLAAAVAGTARAVTSAPGEVLGAVVEAFQPAAAEAASPLGETTPRATNWWTWLALIAGLPVVYVALRRIGELG